MPIRLPRTLPILEDPSQAVLQFHHLRRPVRSLVVYSLVRVCHQHRRPCRVKDADRGNRGRALVVKVVRVGGVRPQNVWVLIGLGLLMKTVWVGLGLPQWCGVE